MSQYFPGSDEPLSLPRPAPSSRGSSSAPSTGSFAACSLSTNRSDGVELGDPPSREETLKSVDSRIPLHFKPSKVPEARLPPAGGGSVP